MVIDSLDKCRLASEKRWSETEVELQKIKDELVTMSTRLNKQEAVVGDIQQLSLNVASLSQNMQQMLDEMRKQNDRLNNLEQKPIKRWDGILDTIVKVVLTAALGVILYKIGLQ